jgi:serine/threonine-protein kinase SRPK3
LKPENVLIAIDDVESLITSELSSSQPSSARLIGVPPSKGRGGNQTPRAESIYITGSQPLPSPSSSFGSSPMLDRWQFGMSKIEDGGAGGSQTGTDEAAHAMGRVSLEGSPVPASAKKPTPGPSLLSQQAPLHATPETPDATPVPGTKDEGVEIDQSGTELKTDDGLKEDLTDAALLEERITVKIADLGNGELLPLRWSWRERSQGRLVQWMRSSTCTARGRVRLDM